MRNIRTLKTVVIATLVCVCMQTVCAADPLLVQVSCQGCSDKVSISDGYKFYADAGKSVTLTASPSGGIGSKNCSWMENGIMVCRDQASFQLTVAEDSVEYTLIVTDNGGRVSKTVKIVPNFYQEPKCLPDFRREITIRDHRMRDRVKYLAGDNFTVEAYLNMRDCPNSDYQFYWTADDPNVIFANPNSTKTKVRIGRETDRGKVKIEAVIANRGIERDRNIEIEIISDVAPPEFDIEHDEEIYSCERFKVWPSNVKLGEQDESGDILYIYSADLVNEGGVIVSSASPKSGKASYLYLKTDGFKGIYSIRMTIEDSYGMSTTVVEPIGNILRGRNDRNAPLILVSNDTIYCVVGEICRIDASKTTRRDRNAVGFEYWLMHEGKKFEQLSSSISGGFCSGPQCSQVFEYPGTYTIMVEAKYFDDNNRRESRVGFKMITVIVSPDNVSAMPTPVLAPMVAPIIVPTPARPVAYVKTSATKNPEMKDEGFKKIPSYITGIMNAIKNALNL